jgi:hypothetical protein
MNTTKIKWFDKPQKHDYSAAQAYLSLTMEVQEAKAIAAELKKSKMTSFLAQDIFRSSGLSLLGVSNGDVERVRAQIIRNEEISPLLLYRDKSNRKLVIADGYHRLCAVYGFDEEAVISCKIV